VLAAAIFLGSSTRSSNLPGPFPPGTDKVLHAVVYAALGALIARAWWRRARQPITRLRLVLWAALMATGYGLSDEIHQLFVPGRHFDLADLAADALGAVLGAILVAKKLGGSG
jgi:VanZ family protein